MTKTAKILSYFLFATLLILVILLWQGKPATAPQISEEAPTNNQTELKIDFQFDKDQSISLQYPYESFQNLLTITENVAKNQAWNFDQETYPEMGVLITQIKDKINGQDGKYWQYRINGRTPLLSVDQYFPQSEDHIKWIFETSEF